MAAMVRPLYSPINACLRAYSMCHHYMSHMHAAIQIEKKRNMHCLVMLQKAGLRIMFVQEYVYACYAH